MEKRPSFRLTIYWLKRPVYLSLILSAIVVGTYAIDLNFGLWNNLLVELYPLTKVLLFYAVAALLAPWFLWNLVAWRRTAYAMGDKQFAMSKGVFSRKKYVADYENVQNINVERSFLEILLMVSTVRIETAGSKPGESEIALEGISSGEAERLVRDVSHLAGEAKGRMRGIGPAGGGHDYGMEIAELRESQGRILEELSEMRSLLSSEKRKRG